MISTASDLSSGLGFWLRYAEREGALFEGSGDTGGTALVVLPSSLQDAFELPEEVTVTSDPEVAREEGALLVIPGNPVLQQAAADVLGRGDAGCAHLPWPASPPRRTADLVARAREQFGVDHGRIDGAGEPAAVYVPLLRVGALVTYTLSLDEVFQEREEVWLDARTGLPVNDATRRVVETGAWLSGLPSDRPSLFPELAVATREGHTLLERRVRARLPVLAGAIRGSLGDELARAEAFYEATLESIASRRESASAERRAIYDAQAEATRGERERRLAEIEEKYRATHDIRPFRLHLVLVPGLVVPVSIRRGARAHAFTFTWLTAASAFVRPRCPRCGEAAPLVAGREHLGCRVCLPRPSPPRLETAPGATTAPNAPNGGEQRAGPPPAPPPAPGNGREDGPRPAGRPGGVARSSSGRVTPRKTEISPARVHEVGERLGVQFWQTVADGKRWPRKHVASHSPLEVLYRLYGTAGPALAVGLTPGGPLLAVFGTTADPWAGLPEVTTGLVAQGAERHPFTLSWRLEAGKPVLLELLPFLDAVDSAFPPPTALTPEMARYLHTGIPRPRGDLDPVACVLFEVSLPLVGLPLVVRCLAAWSRILASGAPVAGDAVVAAALVQTVGARAGVRQARQAATTHGADPAEVARAAQVLRSRLRLSNAQPW